MTKEEAIKILEEYRSMLEGFMDHDKPAFTMAIESLSAEPNCQKCAIKELWEETEKEDLVAVVRCKDCIHRIDRRLDLGRFVCEMFYGQGDVSDENFCQWGKRKTNNQRTQPQAFRYNTK